MTGARLLYGFDPLCGWCFGGVPAMRALAAALPGLPVDLAVPGLVTGDRVGPYAAMEDYIRGASVNLLRVTGRAPSDAFFDLIRRPGVRGDSGPPALVLAAARDRDPARAVDLAHRVTEAHFIRGADLNDPATYPDLIRAAGLDMPVPDLSDRAAAEALWDRERRHGIARFPTLILMRDGRGRVLPGTYDPAALVALVRGLVAA